MKNTNSPSLDRRCVNAIRFLAVDAVEKAKSGHPGMPMGMADCAYVLWTRHLRYMPSDPFWPDRDRFVLSAGHGSMLLYAMLHLCGFDVSMDDIRRFRQWGSRTPGHPEFGSLPGVETTTGPLGQGFANGVGMALAAKIKAGMFNRGGFQPVSHRIYGIVSDGDLMEGISAEAASLAGHLGLGNLIYIYDNNKITIEGSADLAFSEDVSGRFQACGWHTLEADGHDHGQMDRALTCAAEETQRPTLIIASTHIGCGSPGKQDTADSHGAPLGPEEVILSRQNLQWEEPPFSVPSDVMRHFGEVVAKRSRHHAEWTRGMDGWRKSYPDLSEKWDRFENRSMPEGLIDSLLKTVSEDDQPTRAWSGKILQTASSLLPALIGGSADLGPSNKSLIKGSASIKKDTFSGRNIHFGIREHAMGGILNGMALSGLIPYGATFLVFSDYMRPAIRLAALMKLRVIYLFTHDSLFVGEDGPTHQPVEHLAALRIIPDLTVFRPADGLETAAAWAEALENRGPTALILTRQKVPSVNRIDKFRPDWVRRGGYILKQEKSPDIILAASGSEVALCLYACSQLEKKGKKVRVVSMPCRERFERQGAEYRRSVLTPGIPVLIVEAARDHGWKALTEGPMLFHGMQRFGASAPYPVLAGKFGFTAEAVAGRAEEWLKGVKGEGL